MNFLSLITSLYFTIHSGSRFSRKKRGSGKGWDNIYFSTAYCSATHCPSLWWVSSLWHCCRTGGARPAWSGGVKGRKRRTRTERRESEELLDDDTLEFVQLFLMWGTFKIWHLSKWHFLFFSSFLKGSSGSGGSGVLGPKGEPGERVSSHWQEW